MCGRATDHASQLRVSAHVKCAQTGTRATRRPMTWTMFQRSSKKGTFRGTRKTKWELFDFAPKTKKSVCVCVSVVCRALNERVSNNEKLALSCVITANWHGNAAGAWKCKRRGLQWNVLERSAQHANDICRCDHEVSRPRRGPWGSSGCKRSRPLIPPKIARQQPTDQT